LTKRYLDQYAAAGAKVLRHGPFRDDLTLLYVREETLRDRAKAAALREYVQLWARAAAWTETHEDEWARVYWVQNQGLSSEEARSQIEAYGPRDIPTDWSQAIAIEQSVIELLAPSTSQSRFDATTLFDRRFESVASGAFMAAGGRVAADDSVPARGLQLANSR
jgi:sulfonate transport system substrate-binding protein